MFQRYGGYCCLYLHVDIDEGEPYPSLTLVFIYQITRCKNPKSQNMAIINLKTLVLGTTNVVSFVYF